MGKDSNDNPKAMPEVRTAGGLRQSYRTGQRTDSESSYEPQDTYEIPALMGPSLAAGGQAAKDGPSTLDSDGQQEVVGSGESSSYLAILPGGQEEEEDSDGGGVEYELTETLARGEAKQRLNCKKEAGPERWGWGLGWWPWRRRAGGGEVGGAVGSAGEGQEDGPTTEEEKEEEEEDYILPSPIGSGLYVISIH